MLLSIYFTKPHGISTTFHIQHVLHSYYSETASHAGSVSQGGEAHKGSKRDSRLPKQFSCISSVHKASPCLDSLAPMKIAITPKHSLGDSNDFSTLLLALCFHKPRQNLILLSTFLHLSCLTDIRQQMLKVFRLKRHNSRPDQTACFLRKLCCFTLVLTLFVLLVYLLSSLLLDFPISRYNVGICA